MSNLAHLARMKPGAELRHLIEPVDAIVDHVDGGIVFVITPYDREPQRSLPGDWEVTKDAPEQLIS